MVTHSINSLKYLSDDNVTLNLRFYPQEYFFEPVWNFAGIIESYCDDSDSDSSTTV